MGKITLSGEPIRNGIDEDEVLLGFDRMTDSEIMYVADRSPYPEYMGGKVKEWLQRRKKRAKAFVGKVKAKYKKLPKWAKIATGIFAAPALAAAAIPAAAALVPATVGAVAPLAAAAAPAAPFGIAALARKRAAKRKAMLSKMTPQQRADYAKKRKRRLGVAAALVPGLGLTALTAVGAAKGVKAIRKRRAARLAARRAAARTGGVSTVARPVSRPAPAAMAPVPMQAVPVPSEPDEQGTVQQAPEEQKKGGLGGLLGLGALAALPFLL